MDARSLLAAFWFLVDMCTGNRPTAHIYIYIYISICIIYSFTGIISYAKSLLVPSEKKLKSEPRSRQDVWPTSYKLHSVMPIIALNSGTHRRVMSWTAAYVQSTLSVVQQAYHCQSLHNVR